VPPSKAPLSRPHREPLTPLPPWATSLRSWRDYRCVRGGRRPPQAAGQAAAERIADRVPLSLSQSDPSALPLLPAACWAAPGAHLAAHAGAWLTALAEPARGDGGGGAFDAGRCIVLR
jgi:hypothetical protein